VAEWLRRWTANPLCFAREGSNPFLVEFFIFLYYNFILKNKKKSIFEHEKKYLTAVGFEPTPAFADQNTHFYVKLCFKLESGALDHSATLSYEYYDRYLKFIYSSLSFKNNANHLSYQKIKKRLIKYFTTNQVKKNVENDLVYELFYFRFRLKKNNQTKRAFIDINS
jgi:hypothetical protein